jgi:ATP-dependent Clp endopeptidase proteolytic subunit ClpP
VKETNTAGTIQPFPVNMPTKEIAEIALIQAQTNKAAFEAEKERLLAAQQSLVLEDARRTWDSNMAANQEHRVYDFIGAVTTISTEQAIQQLAKWERQDKTKPITIRLTSPGGSVWDGITLFDYIEGLKSRGLEVNVVVFGMAASMATILLQAGTKRIVSPNAQIMVHEMEITNPMSQKVSEQEESAAFSKKLNDRLYEIIANRCKLSKLEVSKRAHKKDWWMNAQEAIDLGIADEIGFE